jgi:hypothetical protein
MLNTADHSYQGLITGLHRRSVTTILAQEGYIAKQFYREGFAELGTQCHKLLDAFDKGLKFKAPDIYLRYLEPYKAMLDTTGIKIIDSEVEIEEPMLGYAGTLDKLVSHPRMGCGIMDVKFSSCGYLAWHEYQTEGYRQGLRWHPKYKGMEIKWRGGIILSPDCELPKIINHDRIPEIEKIWRAICIVNADKHRHKVRMEEITAEEGWW